MKKKLIYSLLAVCSLATAITSCKDFLEVTSPSVVDADFVYKDLSTAEAAMAGLRESWRSCSGSYVYGAGAFYALDVPGSDIERHPESYTAQPQRHFPEGFYENGTAVSTFCTNYSIDQADAKNTYTALYATIMLANNAITAIENKSNYNEIVNANAPSAWGFLYGQAVAARAQCYLDLTRYYGDVPYLTKGGQNVTELTPRDVIYEGEIAKLKLVEPLMYRPGETDADGNTVGKGVFTRTFVQGLIGRLCLFAGGYSTRRNDITYINTAGNTLSFDKIGSDNNGAFYGRRTDYEQFYTIAKTYLDAAVANPGSTVIFHTTDPRSTDLNGRIFNNPYQYFFQQLLDDVGTSTAFADESVYEVPMTRGVSNERPYSSGRVSNGGSSNAYPCKGYGQSRLQPTYYYGWFDPNDMRRDVTVTVTGSSGKGVETLIPFSPGSKASGGGLCLNKFDENRQANPYTISQRNSGINAPFMRISDIYLMDAEVNAVLNYTSIAYGLLKQVHERAFASATLANVDGFITNAGSLYKAIIKERALEFGGEGDRRKTLLRTGLIADAVNETRAEISAMVTGLTNNLSYTFSNGNIISYYIWTAVGDLKTAKGYRLTTQCSDETSPYLFPGWRGQYDSWETLGATAISGNKTNLAIKGLFSQYTPTKVKITYSDKTTATVSGMTFIEMMQLMKAGTATSIVEQDTGLSMALTAWGSNIVANSTEFYTKFFPNFDGTLAPIYFYPINSNTINGSNGIISNGYGFSQ
jgi:starch-binding outer membrane protein, SusD/RagB family